MFSYRASTYKTDEVQLLWQKGCVTPPPFIQGHSISVSTSPTHPKAGTTREQAPRLRPGRRHKLLSSSTASHHPALSTVRWAGESCGDYSMGVYIVDPQALFRTESDLRDLPRSPSCDRWFRLCWAPRPRLHPTFFLSFLFCLFRAKPVAYGGSEARDRIGATAPGLHHSHCDTGLEPHL